MLKTHSVHEGLTANGEVVTTPDFVGQVGESCAQPRTVLVDIHRKSANAKLLCAIEIVDLRKPQRLCSLDKSGMRGSQLAIVKPANGHRPRMPMQRRVPVMVGLHLLEVGQDVFVRPTRKAACRPARKIGGKRPRKVRGIDRGAATKHASTQLDRCVRRARRAIIPHQFRVGDVGRVAHRLRGFAGSKRRSRLQE